jgi:cation diffusion facilitator family transporter
VKTRAHYEFPPEKQETLRKAKWLEWFTIVYLVSAIALLAVVLGSSQAMKAAWIEDILSLAPPIAFLVALRVREKEPNRKFPWGYHRAVSVAYLTASLALLTLGGYILIDSVLKLVKAEHPPIGLIEVFGHDIWLGWLMIAALVYSGLPPVILGRMKLPLAAEMHDKVLFADAEMNKADWMTAGAAIVGIVGIGFGLWWADAVAATLISLDIVHDGWKNLKLGVFDLMDSRPKKYDGSGEHPLPERVTEHLRGLDWVEDARVRLREEGHVLTGQALVIPATGEEVPENAEKTMAELEDFDWQLHDVVVAPVSELEGDEQAAEQEREQP